MTEYERSKEELRSARPTVALCSCVTGPGTPRSDAQRQRRRAGPLRAKADWLCADARMAIELDGAQHPADADAYRRDRRKDLLLQESGHLVLRFLAEDVGKRLDEVLDAILRMLSHRKSAR